MIDVFTLKRISPDCLFKSNHSQMKISILIPQCAIYLRGGLPTAEIISAVCCTPPRSSPRCVAHRWDHLCRVYRDHLHGVHHAAEIIATVHCAPRRSSLQCVAHCGDNFVIEYLDEIETEFENTLACLGSFTYFATKTTCFSHSEIWPSLVYSIQYIFQV